MENNRWDLIRAVHSEFAELPPHIVDYIAVRDILFSSVSGISNKSIANFYGMNEGYVLEVLLEFLDYDGLVNDIPVRPYLLYKQSKDIFEFADRAQDFIEFSVEIIDMYNACKIFEKIKEEIIKYDY